MFLTIISSSSIGWLISEFCFSLIAAGGGIVVLRGLWLEGYEEKEEFRDQLEMKSVKSREKQGRKFVFWGVAIEVLLAFAMSFKDGWEIRQMEKEISKNDPRKQPIFALSGHAMILARPLEKLEDFDNDKLEKLDVWPPYFKIRLPAKGNAGDVGDIQIMFGRAKDMAISLGSSDLAWVFSDNISETISTYGGGKLLRFDVYFGDRQELFYNPSLTPDDLDAVNLLIPVRCEIISGQIDVSINHEFIKRVFQIPKQTTFDHSVSSVSSNGTFSPLNWSSELRSGFAKSEEKRIETMQKQSDFIANGATLEAKANGKKSKIRTVSDQQQDLFIDLLKDYPKAPIKVFTISADDESRQYALRIRKLLDAAGYGGSNCTTISNFPTLNVNGPNQVQWPSSLKKLAFVIVPDAKLGPFVPVHIPLNSIRPVISSGFTNDPTILAIGELHCVKWAFTGIGLDGIDVVDNTAVLKPGETAIIVPPKSE